MEPVNEHLVCRNAWVRIVGERSENITQVQEIFIDGIITTHGQSVLWEEVYGIDLTTDWLEAAGFCKLGHDLYGRTDFGCAIIPDACFIAEVNGAMITGLRFVHELQQLYGAIKQRPLIIPIPAANA